MGIGKWLLLGGAGYLGYKMLIPEAAKGFSTEGIQAFLEKMRAQLDPKVKWEVMTQQSTGIVHVEGANAAGQKIVDRTFKTLAEALAWVSVSQVTGQQAIVNWQGHA